MDMLRLGQPDNFWNAPTYSVKVRGSKFLWGSAGIVKNLTFEKPFILHIANDLAGEPVAIGTLGSGGNKTEFGKIEPGECISIPVNDISGVYAECAPDLDSILHCLIY